MNRTDALVDVRRSLHERLIGRVDARQLDAMPRAERRLRVREEALSLLREQGHMLPQSALADVVNAVSDAVVGMGPIEFLLKDPDVTEGLLSIWALHRRGVRGAEGADREGGWNRHEERRCVAMTSEDTLAVMVASVMP